MCNCDSSYVLAKADIAFYKHINWHVKNSLDNLSFQGL